MNVRNISVNALLVVLSLLVAGVIVEVCLRMFFPNYQYAAESRYDPDALRIWSRRPNVYDIRTHPDTGLTHPIIYNNLAMRQHRQITSTDFDSAINIGFFGDSQTENLRLAAQHSHTEPLDYLLNTTGRRFNVLNFGVDGYGTGQCYLYYKYSPVAKRLSHVFYMLSGNDLRNIYENNLFSLSETDTLVRNHVPQTPWWLKVVSRLHLTYFLLDVRLKLIAPEKISFRKALDQRYSENYLKSERLNRFHSERADAIDKDLKNQQENLDLQRSIVIFRLILQQWRQDVEDNGAKFYIVLLPTRKDHLFRNLINSDFAVIDLYELFKSIMQDYDYKHVSFANDGHWNETGNVLAAVQLYRVLEQAEHLPLMPAEQLKKYLYTYYSAFPNGWMPPTNWILQTDIPVPNQTRIRDKYLALELKSRDNQTD